MVKWLEMWAMWQVIAGLAVGLVVVCMVVWLLVTTWKQVNRCEHDVHTRWKNGHSFVKCHKCGRVWED